MALKQKTKSKIIKFPGSTPNQIKSTKVPPSAELYAALDLGTNSCRMLIAQPNGNQFHVVDSFSKTVQLGAGLEGTGKLSKISMARTIAQQIDCSLDSMSSFHIMAPRLYKYLDQNQIYSPQ